MQKEANTHHPLKQVFIKTESGCIGQIIDDIMYLTAQNGCIVFHTADGQEQTCSKTLEYYVPRLAEYNFVRIHNSTLLNMDYFKEYHKGRGGEVLLLNGKILTVSVKGKLQLDLIMNGDIYQN